MHAEYSHTYQKLTCARLRNCHRNDDSAQPRNRSIVTDPFPLLRMGSGDETKYCGGVLYEDHMRFDLCHPYIERLPML